MKQKFGKFTAIIEPNEDREGVNCYIETEGGYMSSLACADDTGLIEDTVVISPATLDKISRWAESHGY